MKNKEIKIKYTDLFREDATISLNKNIKRNNPINIDDAMINLKTNTLMIDEDVLVERIDLQNVECLICSFNNFFSEYHNINADNIYLPNLKKLVITFQNIKNINFPLFSNCPNIEEINLNIYNNNCVYDNEIDIDSRFIGITKISEDEIVFEGNDEYSENIYTIKRKENEQKYVFEKYSKLKKAEKDIKNNKLSIYGDYDEVNINSWENSNFDTLEILSRRYIKFNSSAKIFEKLNSIIISCDSEVIFPYDKKAYKIKNISFPKYTLMNTEIPDGFNMYSLQYFGNVPGHNTKIKYGNEQVDINTETNIINSIGLNPITKNTKSIIKNMCETNRDNYIKLPVIDNIEEVIVDITKENDRASIDLSNYKNVDLTTRVYKNKFNPNISLILPALEKEKYMKIDFYKDNVIPVYENLMCLKNIEIITDKTNILDDKFTIPFDNDEYIEKLIKINGFYIIKLLSKIIIVRPNLGIITVKKDSIDFSSIENIKVGLSNILNKNNNDNNKEESNETLDKHLEKLYNKMEDYGLSDLQKQNLLFEVSGFISEYITLNAKKKNDGEKILSKKYMGD